MKPKCPSCNVDMEESFLEIPQMGTHYNSMKCPKCNRVMISDDTVDAFKFDIFTERGVDWTEHDRIMRKYLISKGVDPDDGEELWKHDQLISYYIRQSTKYISKSDKNCPRCGNGDVWAETENKVGKVCGCKKCDFKWFYEFP